MKKKQHILLRLQNDGLHENAKDISIKSGFVQTLNGVKVPNLNKLGNLLFEFAAALDAKGVSMSVLQDDDFISKVTEEYNAQYFPQ